jgi:alpha-D-ribose 1-methylphosphonate 5-triphosphate synthase subunit PhnH
MGVREKKITVKFFLNTDVKGRRLELGGGVMYPLYTRVTYDRRSTKFSVGNHWFSKEQEAAIKNNKELQVFKQVLTRIVNFEALREGESFRVAGLGVRIKTYVSHLFQGLIELLGEALKTELETELTVKEYKSWANRSILDRIANGIEKLDTKVTRDLENLLIAASIFGSLKDKHPIMVYGWLMGESRKETIKSIRNGILKMIEDKVDFKAFNRRVPIQRLAEESEFALFTQSIDNACLQLLEKGYSEYIDIKNIKIMN